LSVKSHHRCSSLILLIFLSIMTQVKIKWNADELSRIQHGIFVTHQNFNTGEDRPRLSIFSIHVTFSNLFKCFTLYIRFVTQNICLYIFLRIFRAKLSLCNNENSKIIILIYYRKKNSKIIILIYYRTNEKLLYNRIYLF